MMHLAAMSMAGAVVLANTMEAPGDYTKRFEKQTGFHMDYENATKPTSNYFKRPDFNALEGNHDFDYYHQEGNVNPKFQRKSALDHRLLDMIGSEVELLQNQGPRHPAYHQTTFDQDALAQGYLSRDNLFNVVSRYQHEKKVLVQQEANIPTLEKHVAESTGFVSDLVDTVIRTTGIEALPAGVKTHEITNDMAELVQLKELAMDMVYEIGLNMIPYGDLVTRFGRGLSLTDAAYSLVLKSPLGQIGLLKGANYPANRSLIRMGYFVTKKGAGFVVRQGLVNPLISMWNAIAPGFAKASLMGNEWGNARYEGDLNADILSTTGRMNAGSDAAWYKFGYLPGMLAGAVIQVPSVDDAVRLYTALHAILALGAYSAAKVTAGWKSIKGKANELLDERERKRFLKVIDGHVRNLNEQGQPIDAQALVQLKTAIGGVTTVGQARAISQMALPTMPLNDNITVAAAQTAMEGNSWKQMINKEVVNPAMDLYNRIGGIEGISLVEMYSKLKGGAPFVNRQQLIDFVKGGGRRVLKAVQDRHSEFVKQIRNSKRSVQNPVAVEAAANVVVASDVVP